MARYITSETLEGILSRCLKIPFDAEDGNTRGITCRGCGGEGTTVWHIYGRFGVPENLHEYWRDYVRNELVRRDIPSDVIEFRSAMPDEEPEGTLDGFCLRHLLSFAGDSTLVLSKAFEIVAYTTGPRRYHHIFLFRDALNLTGE